MTPARLGLLIFTLWMSLVIWVLTQHPGLLTY